MIRIYRLVHELALARSPHPFQPVASENCWNSADTQIAYGSEHLALSALELLTYWGYYPTMYGYQLFIIEIGAEKVEDVLAKRPAIDPHSYSQTRDYGDAWAEEQRSLTLKVPSVILPLSYNYLINPKHPDFSPEMVVSFGAFEYDVRIAKLIAQAKRNLPSA